MIEIWKDVKGYNGLYQVSNYGNIKSLSRIIVRSNGNYSSKEKLLEPQIIKNGYLVVRLKKNGNRSTKLINRLVAESFIPNPEDKLEVNHKDLNKLNNHVDNLEWSTRSENMKHAYKNGVVDINKAIDKLKTVTKNDVVEIRKRKLNGESRKSVYEDYKHVISIGGFKHIWYNVTWENIKVE